MHVAGHYFSLSILPLGIAAFTVNGLEQGREIPPTPNSNSRSNNRRMFE